MTACRARFDRRLAQLGPDILAPELDEAAFLRRLREDDPTRPIGDALLDQRVIAGIGNLWKAEGCFEAADRPVAAHRRRHRRGGAGDRPRHPAADAGVRARRHAGALQGRLRHRRRAVPALRRGVAHPGARAGRRQPDDILVSTMSALRRIGHKGADLIVPGNTPASFDAALAARRGHDRVRRARARGPAAARARLRARRRRADARGRPRPPRRRARSTASSSTSTSSCPATRSARWTRCASTA